MLVTPRCSFIHQTFSSTSNLNPPIGVISYLAREILNATYATNEPNTPHLFTRTSEQNEITTLFLSKQNF
jgi:hypothetical protein